MTMSEVRKVAGAETPDGLLAWSPQLDLRNCGPQMLTQAIVALKDEASWPTWVADFLAARQVSHAELAEACVAFVAAFTHVRHHPDDTLAQALADRGFLALRPEAQMPLMALVGLRAVGMIEYAVREASAVGAETPYAAVLARMGAAADETAAALAGPRRAD
jgi:hypothetical protein